MDAASTLTMLDVVAQEAALFSAMGFLVGGLDDLGADLLYLAFARKAEPPSRRRLGIDLRCWCQPGTRAR